MMNIFAQNKTANQLWKITGSFGELNEEVVWQGNTFSAENGKISVVSCMEDGKNGVFVRNGKVKNISDDTVTIFSLSSKFSFDGGEYDVYSQYNGWQCESLGKWQSLVSTISATSTSVRNSHGSSPFMVLWSNQANRGTAFHLNAYSSWEMKISRVHISCEKTIIEVELGVVGSGLAINLFPGEELELPEIIFYTVFNKVDMDCWKLHGYLNEKYPRKTVPVIYNTWLCSFDHFTVEDVSLQIEKAQKLGVEYFVIDAGWFGNNRIWWSSRGDWDESENFGFKGQMSEVADRVRSAGMKFGLWLEPECASFGAKIVEKYPGYFIKGQDSYFIDFANEEAGKYIFEKICSVIDKYGAEFVKFDFNADLDFDRYNSGFTKYAAGHRKFIEKLRQKYPNLYIENCGSGGARMTIRDGKAYDSFWPTDNQSPYHSLRIFKDSILRMSPQWIENWISVCSIENMIPTRFADENSDKLLSTNDALWDSITGVHNSFLKGFLTGGPIGLSFDLTSLSENAFEELGEFISNFKSERDFWKDAVCHILTDTESTLVLEFRNSDFSKIELVVFTHKMMQTNIRIYPQVDTDFKYRVSQEEIISGCNLKNNGIDVPIKKSYSAQFVTLQGV